jgi:hypothetical protein
VPVPGYAIAQAFAAGAVGFKAVKDILAVNVPGGGGYGTPGTSPGRPPSFNVVDNSSQNQLNQLIAGQTKVHLEAFVVESNNHSPTIEVK